MKRILIDLPPHLVDSYDKESGRLGISRAELVRRVLLDYMDGRMVGRSGAVVETKAEVLGPTQVTSLEQRRKQLEAEIAELRKHA